MRYKDKENLNGMILNFRSMDTRSGRPGKFLCHITKMFA